MITDYRRVTPPKLTYTKWQKVSPELATRRYGEGIRKERTAFKPIRSADSGLMALVQPALPLTQLAATPSISSPTTVFFFIRNEVRFCLIHVIGVIQLYCYIYNEH